jgi:beta-1,2-mannosidase
MKIRIGYVLIVLVGVCCSVPPANKSVDNAGINADFSWTLLPFIKQDSVNPVLGPGQGSFMCPVRKIKVSWEQKDVFNPAIIVKDGKVFMLYRAQDSIGKPSGTSRIGLATSSDGIHFLRQGEPVLYPDNDAQKKYEWEGGCEDPRVVEDSSGNYIMTYTAYDGNLARLMIATSPDLSHWTKKGPAFAKAKDKKYLDKWSKSGSIVSTYRDGKVIATKLNGKYWMYWGDQNICVATSDDLVAWDPVEMGPNEHPPVPLVGQALKEPSLKIVVPTRNKKFDSYLVESGPPAMVTEQGILLIYNSCNHLAIGDSSLPEGTYAAAQVLLDKHDPSRILKRMDSFFMKPDKDYELTGQVNNVCFLEGLAHFQGRWLLYYGTADSRIAVAVR